MYKDRLTGKMTLVKEKVLLFIRFSHLQ